MSKIFVISSPSGGGKTSIIKRILPELKGIRLSISATTRPPRASEKNGVDYNFIQEKKFKEMIARGEFIEYANVYGNLYGTPKAPIEIGFKIGMNALLDIDVQGATRVKELYPDAVTIFIVPPSIEVLRERLLKRATDKGTDIEKRLATAAIEMSLKDSYDHCVVNDDLERASREVMKIIEGER